LSIMVTLVVMEVLSLGTTFENEWKNLWRKWLSKCLCWVTNPQVNCF
jgi:hypothetical protein